MSGEVKTTRGSDKPIPIVEHRIVLWRGTAKGIPRMPHAKTGFYHDLGEGLYLTFDRMLAEQYARGRATNKNHEYVYIIIT